MKKNRITCKIKRKWSFLTILGVFLFQLSAAAGVSAAADSQPPAVPGGLCAANVTCTSISLVWNTAGDNVGVKGYHLFRDGKKIVSTSKTSYTNNDLVPGRKYTYMVRAYDAAGNISGDSPSLAVTAKSDLQPPSQPAGLTVLSAACDSITLAWTASTDNTSVRGYEVYCNGKRKTTVSATYYACRGLIPGTKYDFSVKACDIAGNSSPSSSILSAATMTDSMAPSVPTELKAIEVTGMEIEIAWSPSSDNVKVKGYEIYCGGEKITATSKTSYTHKKLLPGKTYSYYIKAVDSTGNSSPGSSLLTAATLPDTEPPTSPAGLKVKSATKSSASLSWTASKDNLKVKGYLIYCNGLQIAETAMTHYTVKSPFRLGIDIFHVKAYDLAGNQSGSSNKVTVITLD